MTLAAEASVPEQFRELVTARFGLRFDDSKLPFLSDLLHRRAEARGRPVDAYLADVDTEEAARLAEELTVGETYFFRNNDQFQAFREIALPDRLRARKSGRLSLLSAGCSSGEEPYTLAMICDDALPEAPAIRAVDLNPAALRKAAAARYHTWSLRETSEDMQQKWFRPAGRDLILNDRLRAAVHFDRRNITEADPDLWKPESYDVVFCRNVIMYFTPTVQQSVIAHIARALVPGGYLFLGHAETLRGLSHAFHLRHTHDTFYYQRRDTLDATPPSPPSAFDLSIPLPAEQPLTEPPDISWFDSIGDATRRVEALASPRLTEQRVTLRTEKPAPASPANTTTALDLLRHERFDDALALLDRGRAAATPDPDALLLEASLLLQANRLAAAAEVCRTLLELDELNAGANYVLALCFEGNGDSTSALLHYDLAIHLDPAFAMPLMRRGMVARRRGETDTARADLQRALELLQLEDASRLLLFGGGFTRSALASLCQAELRAAGGTA